MAFPSSLQETAKFCTWGSKSLQNRKGRRQHSRAVAKESTNSPHLPNETHTREAISLPKQENPWVSLAVTEGEDLDSDKARETLRESMWFTPHMSATCSPLGPHPPPQPLKLKDLFMNACPSEHPTEAPCFWASLIRSRVSTASNTGSKPACCSFPSVQVASVCSVGQRWPLTATHEGPGKGLALTSSRGNGQRRKDLDAANPNPRPFPNSERPSSPHCANPVGAERGSQLRCGGGAVRASGRVRACALRGRRGVETGRNQSSGSCQPPSNSAGSNSPAAPPPGENQHEHGSLLAGCGFQAVDKPAHPLSNRLVCQLFLCIGHLALLQKRSWHSLAFPFKRQHSKRQLCSSYPNTGQFKYKNNYDYTFLMTKVICRESLREWCITSHSSSCLLLAEAKNVFM